MSCLSVIVERVGGMAASLSRVGGDLAVSTQRISGGLSAKIERKCGDLAVAVTRKKGDLVAVVSLVCDTGIGRFLIVTPSHLWLTPYNYNTDYAEVQSNVAWITSTTQ